MDLTIFPLGNDDQRQSRVFRSVLSKWKRHLLNSEFLLGTITNDFIRTAATMLQPMERKVVCEAR